MLQDSFNGLPEKKIQFCFALFFLKTCFSPLFIVCEILCNWLALRKGVKQIWHISSYAQQFSGVVVHEMICNDWQIVNFGWLKARLSEEIFIRSWSILYRLEKGKGKVYLRIELIIIQKTNFFQFFLCQT